MGDSTRAGETIVIDAAVDEFMEAVSEVSLVIRGQYKGQEGLKSLLSRIRLELDGNPELLDATGELGRMAAGLEHAPLEDGLSSGAQILAMIEVNKEIWGVS